MLSCTRVTEMDQKTLEFTCAELKRKDNLLKFLNDPLEFFRTPVNYLGKQLYEMFKHYVLEQLGGSTEDLFPEKTFYNVLLEMDRIVKNRQNGKLFFLIDWNHIKLPSFLDIEQYPTDTGKFLACDVIFVYGPAGSGKSTWTHKQEPAIFDTQYNKCGPRGIYGYTGQPAVLFDNMTSDCMNPDRLLDLLTKSRNYGDGSGSLFRWKPKRIYITSVLNPGEFAATAGFKKPVKFTSCMTHVVDMIEDVYQ